MPRDVFIGDVYFPTLLLAALAALLVASLVMRLLRQQNLIQHFANPPLVFMALSVVFAVIFGSTLFPT